MNPIEASGSLLSLFGSQLSSLANTSSSEEDDSSSQSTSSTGSQFSSEVSAVLSSYSTEEADEEAEAQLELQQELSLERMMQQKTNREEALSTNPFALDYSSMSLGVGASIAMKNEGQQAFTVADIGKSSDPLMQSRLFANATYAEGAALM